MPVRALQQMYLESIQRFLSSIKTQMPVRTLQLQVVDTDSQAEELYKKTNARKGITTYSSSDQQLFRLQYKKPNARKSITTIYRPYDSKTSSWYKKSNARKGFF